MLVRPQLPKIEPYQPNRGRNSRADTMNVIVLQSGSAGNCCYVESRGVALLFDAGITGRQAEVRLAQHRRSIRDVKGLLISHDHRDHTASMGVYHRRFGLPLHITEKTLAATKANLAPTIGREVRPFVAGATLDFGPVHVETIPTPHDAVDGVAFVVDDGEVRLGILTDLGHLFPQLSAVLATLDAVVLESNYDPQLLERGPYSQALKDRIRGPRGHLSNEEAAELLRTAGSARLRWACLAHLSAENNEPRLAVATHQRQGRPNLPLWVASRSEASAMVPV